MLAPGPVPAAICPGGRDSIASPPAPGFNLGWKFKFRVRPAFHWQLRLSESGRGMRLHAHGLKLPVGPCRRIGAAAGAPYPTRRPKVAYCKVAL